MSGNKSKRVLVVEHDDGIATALEYLISREGLAQDRVTTGSAALDSIRRFRPDLVVLDAAVPGMSGYDICRSVRSDRELSHIKILMMTARGPAGERRRGTDQDADGFVSKPFELNDLREQMRRLLGPGA